MGKKKGNGVVGLAQVDLGTLLGCLGSDLRNAGQAVRMMGSELDGPEGQAFRDADRLAGSLDRISDMLDAAQGRLCRDCRLATVSELLAFGRTAASGHPPSGR